MNRNLLTALATLTLFGCGSTESTVTSFREVDPAQSASVVTRSLQELRAQQVEGEELVARSVIQDDTGAQHVRYDKRYQGLRVIGGDFVAHHDSIGTLRAISAASQASLKGLSLKPTIDAAGATV